MKRHILVILVILSAVVMFGCSEKNKEKNESYLEKFMKEAGYSLDLSS